MSENERKHTPGREIYETPTALRLDSLQSGIGDCGTGSGEAEYCHTYGSSAGKTCIADGSSADES